MNTKASVSNPNCPITADMGYCSASFPVKRCDAVSLTDGFFFFFFSKSLASHIYKFTYITDGEFEAGC